MVRAQDASLVAKSVDNIDIVADPTKLFNDFIQSQTCAQTFSTFLGLCRVIDVNYPPSPSTSITSSSDHLTFYPRLKKKLSAWKAQSIWSKLDKRFFGKEYFVNPKLHKSGGQRAGADTKVLIIGAGPCGLRTAIEMACLGTKVVVLEKRDNFSRNNVLHLWPYIITDLKALGAKKLYGKFCAGAIDHISIRQLQLILLKIALMVGVEVIFNVSFENLMPPADGNNENEEDVKGWTAEVNPSNHSISKYEFDVVVGADGKRNTLKGFKRKEFRGKLAIGLTVNFINRNTTAEAKVEEISGVAYIFNQEFFKGLHRETGIDLENIVYYKGETHYFVMTAKKHSLLSKGVLKQDFDETSKLLSYKNVDLEAMMSYALEAADFSTHHQLPTMDFAINHFGQPDVALFDFTCMYAAENAALFRETRGHKLLSCLVGDSLLEPFWPMGTGCARGFLAAFDTVWMTKQWSLKRSELDSSDRSVELQVSAERESIYRLLHQTTPQNTMKNHAAYTIDPNTRYVNLNTKLVAPHQVSVFYLSDRAFATPTGNQEKIFLADSTGKIKKETGRSSLIRKVSVVRSSKLLSWCRRITDGYPGVHLVDMSSSWKSGLAICALIHRFRPDLINWNDLVLSNVEDNNQLAFDVAEKQLGISPGMTGKEMAETENVDKLFIVTYMSQFYEMFKHETPTGIPPTVKDEETKVENGGTPKSPAGVSLTSPVGLLTRFTQHIKRRSYSVQGKQNDENSKKKKQGTFRKKDDSLLPGQSLEVVHEHQEQQENLKNTEPKSIQIENTTVKLRPKTQPPNDSPSATKPNVHQRASGRISALSNQLISQWEQNAPKPSPRAVKRQVDIPELPSSSVSDNCYFCNRRVYIVERLSAEGHFFHRQCFICSYCGLTLRRGAYEYVKDTGKFFCDATCQAESKSDKYPRKPSADVTETDSAERKFIRRYQTPERIELENMRISMIMAPEDIPEEALARHNFSGSMSRDEMNSPEEDTSDSSDDDIDWEMVLRKASVEHPSQDYTKELLESSIEGYDSPLNNTTMRSWLSDRSYDAVGLKDQLLAGSSSNSEELPESQSSTLVRRKTVTNLTSCSSFNELNQKAMQNGTDPHIEERHYVNRTVQTDMDTSLSVADEEFTYVQAPLRFGKDSKQTTQKPVPLPRKRMKLQKKDIPQVTEVFENIEMSEQNGHTKPTECFFLSVLKSEELEQSEKTDQTLPLECHKNYIPKNELSLLLTLSDNGMKSKKEEQFKEAQKSSILDILSHWLLGDKIEDKPEQKKGIRPLGFKDSDASELSDADNSCDESDSSMLSDADNLSPGSEKSSSAALLDGDDVTDGVTANNTVTPNGSFQPAATAATRDSLRSAKTASQSDVLVQPSSMKPTEGSLVTTETSVLKTDALHSKNAAKSSEKKQEIFTVVSPLIIETTPKTVNDSTKSVENIANQEPNDAKSSRNSSKLSKYDTLDRVQAYLRATPITSSQFGSESAPKETGRQESNSTFISLSSSSESEYHVSDCFDDPPPTEPSPQSGKPHAELRESTHGSFRSTHGSFRSGHGSFRSAHGSFRSAHGSSGNKPSLSRQLSADSFMMNNSRSSRNGTSAWSNFEGDGNMTTVDASTTQKTSELDESLISEYKSCLDESAKKSRASVGRQLSYDSLDRRLKLRLRARNRWLREESKSQKSPSDRGTTPEKSDLVREKPPTPTSTPVSPSSGIVIIEMTPSVDEPLTPSAPPTSRKQSAGGDSDQFYTPLARVSKSPPPHMDTSNLLTKSLDFDVTDEFVSAPTTPDAFTKSQATTEKEMPALPKVPHLEAISPTGSASNTLRKKRDTDKALQEVEERVKRRVEKEKMNKNKSDNTLTVVDANNIKGLDASFSGYSPVPSRKKTSMKKRNKKSKSPKDAQGKHGDNEEKRARHFFRIAPRKKVKKDKNIEAVPKAAMNSRSTLERKYSNQSDREKAILRGERFRITVDRTEPSTSKAEQSDSPDEGQIADAPSNYWSQRRRANLAGLTPEQIDAKITRRVQLAARRQARIEAQKRLRRAQVIQRQLEEIEVKQKDVEERGVELEKLLRVDGEQKEESSYMQDWFKLIQEKNALLRYENELMIHQRGLQLEDVQSRLQQELRERMALDDKNKSSEELQEEKEILQKMLDVVEQRDELVALLEEQRIKERDEFVDSETLLLNKFDRFPESSWSAQ